MTYGASSRNGFRQSVPSGSSAASHSSEARLASARGDCRRVVSGALTTSPQVAGGETRRLTGMSRAVTSAPEFTLLDQAGDGWSLSAHLDAAAVLIFYRGDW